LDCGGKRSATPLFVRSKRVEIRKPVTRSKAPSPLPLQSSLRFASAGCRRSPKCHQAGAPQNSASGFRRWESAAAGTYFSQHLQQPRQSLPKPIKMTMTEMAIHNVLSLITSRLNSSAATPIRMMNTPGILLQKQQRLLVSQHFFSSVGSMTCSFRLVVLRVGHN